MPYMPSLSVFLSCWCLQFAIKKIMKLKLYAPCSLTKLIYLHTLYNQSASRCVPLVLYELSAVAVRT